MDIDAHAACSEIASGGDHDAPIATAEIVYDVAFFHSGEFQHGGDDRWRALNVRRVYFDLRRQILRITRKREDKNSGNRIAERGGSYRVMRINPSETAMSEKAMGTSVRFGAECG